MPNYVQNRIQFDKSIPEHDFRTFLLAVTETVRPDQDCLPDNTETNPNALTVQDFTNARFDFNKLIPMPESMNIESGTMTDVGLTLYKTMRNLDAACCDYITSRPNWYDLFHGGSMDAITAEYKAFTKHVHPDIAKNVSEKQAERAMQRLNELYEAAKRTPDMSAYKAAQTEICRLAVERMKTSYEGERLLKSMASKNLNLASPDAFDEYIKSMEGASQYKLGKTAYENLKKYGASTWYDWCCANWGTKWNAMDCHINVNDRVVAFQTAWSAPEPIVMKCVELFPNITFTWQYADEDTGANTGRYDYRNGRMNTKAFDTCCDEAYQTYVDCWGSERSSCLYQDEHGRWKSYTCETCPHPC